MPFQYRASLKIIQNACAKIFVFIIFIMMIIDMKSDICCTKMENIEWECGATNGAEMFEKCFERNFFLWAMESSCLCMRLVDYYERLSAGHTFLVN